jgi:hypothetical protein
MVPVTEAKRTREVESFIVKILVQEELRLNVGAVDSESDGGEGQQWGGARLFLYST